jgi:hypothetical protein
MIIELLFRINAFANLDIIKELMESVLHVDLDANSAQILLFV